jgi:glycosyltransferase involved in cell wall biosynthesis
VTPNNPEALAAALEKLARDPQLRSRMGNSGRQLVMEKFTHKQINAATLKVYQSILN